MAEIKAQDVKTLRERTGAGMMDCKKALGECGGDMEKAVDFLRQKGIANAEKRAGRAMGEGTVQSYIHSNGKIGVMVELSCETDFVAKNEQFVELAQNIAMHIAAANPLGLCADEIAPEVLEREKAVYKAQAIEMGKKEQFIDKIIEGRVEKFFKENCLLNQQYVKNPDITIQDLVTEMIGKIGENISIKRFARFQVGEE